MIDLIVALWATGVHEDRMVTIELLALRPERLSGKDLPLLEELLRRAQTWAFVDPLAETVVGRLIHADPSLAPVLDRWAVDSDFWIRRSALLALLTPCDGEKATLIASPAMPMRRSTSGSSFAKPSRGCCETRASAARS